MARNLTLILGWLPSNHAEKLNSDIFWKPLKSFWVDVVGQEYRIWVAKSMRFFLIRLLLFFNMDSLIDVL